MSGSTREAPTSSATERIQDLQPAIVSEYEAAVRAAVKAVEPLPREALLDPLPQLLDAVSHTSSAPSAARALDALGLKHGKSRAEFADYAPADLGTEQRLLKRVLKTALRRPPALPQPVEDAVMENLDRALGASAAEFARRREREAVGRAGAKERRAFEAMFSASPAAMALWCGAEMVFQFVNPAYQRLFPGRALLGRPILEALPELRDEPFFELLRRVLETGETHGVREQRTQRRASPEGPAEDRYYDLSYRRIDDAEGEPYGVCGHVLDVTDRVLSSRALRQREDHLQEALADLNDERTTRERLVAGLSHDLRTPLSAARMSAYLVGRRAEDQDAVRKNAARITDNLDRVDALLRDVLDVSRISAGQELPLEYEECDLLSVVENAVLELRVSHGERLVLHGEARLPGVWSCAAVRRMLEKLCSDAAKYGAPEQPIGVEVERLGDTAVLRVHSRGTPISADEMAGLFDPIGRPRRALHLRHTGRGFGLTLVKGLAESHGGHLSANTDGASGTTFTVTLPLDAGPGRARRDANPRGSRRDG